MLASDVLDRVRQELGSPAMTWTSFTGSNVAAEIRRHLGDEGYTHTSMTAANVLDRVRLLFGDQSLTRKTFTGTVVGNRVRRILGDTAYTRTAMVGTDIESRAREFLGDNTGTNYWADADIILLINDGVREIWERRVDARFGADDALDTSYTELTALGDAVPILSVWRDALAHYVAGRAYGFDREDQGHQTLSAEHMAEFHRQVQTLSRRVYDVELLDIVNDAIRHIFERRKDARYDTSGTLQTSITELTALSDTAEIVDTWLEAVVQYTCARWYEFLGTNPEGMAKHQANFDRELNGLPPRWLDAELLLWLNDGVREIWNRRPDARYGTDDALDTSYTEATATSDTLAVLSDWRDALVQYVASRASAMVGAMAEKSAGYLTEFLRIVSSQPKRWSDAELIPLINLGVSDIWERRADARHGTDNVLDTSYAPLSVIGSTVPLVSRWRNAVIHFVCWRAYEQDLNDQKAVDRARQHQADYERELMLPRVWQDGELLDLLNDAQREVWQRRPDSRLDATGSYTSGGFTEATATSDTLDILDAWRQPLVDWVCYRAAGFLHGPDNAAKARRHLEAFERGVPST